MKRLIQMNFIRKFTLFIGLSLLLCAVMQAQQPNQRVVRTIEELTEAFATPSLRSDEPTVLAIDPAGIAVTEEVSVGAGKFVMTGGPLYRAEDYKGVMLNVNGGGEITVKNTIQGGPRDQTDIPNVSVSNGRLILGTGGVFTTGFELVATKDLGEFILDGGKMMDSQGYCIWAESIVQLISGIIENDENTHVLYASREVILDPAHVELSGPNYIWIANGQFYIQSPLIYDLSIHKYTVKEGDVILKGAANIPYQLTDADVKHVILENDELEPKLQDNQIVLAKKIVIPDIITTEEELQAAIDASTGTSDAPTEIKISETGIRLTNLITVGSNKHVLLTGGTITTDFYKMFEIQEYSSLTLRQITIDGGYTAEQEKICWGFAVRLGTLIMEDGAVIKGFGLTGDVGIVNLHGGSFYLNGGSISDNYFLQNQSVCSLIYVGLDNGRVRDSYFQMNGGEIARNHGTGKLMFLGVNGDQATIEFRGGEIKDNDDSWIEYYGGIINFYETVTTFQAPINVSFERCYIRLAGSLGFDLNLTGEHFSEDESIVSSIHSYQITQSDVDKIQLPEGYAAVLQDNQIVVKVGDPEPVFDLQALIDAAEEGTLENPSVITLTEDVVLTKTIEVKGKYIKLAGGKTITATVAKNQKLQMFNVTGNGSLTLDNITLDGSAEGYASFAYVDAGATLVLINGTTLKNAKTTKSFYALYVNGNLLMDGCTFAENTNGQSYTGIVVLDGRSQWICKNSVIKDNIGCYKTNTGKTVSGYVFCSYGQSYVQDCAIVNNEGYAIHTESNMRLSHITWKDNTCDMMLVPEFTSIGSESNARTYIDEGGEPTTVEIIGELGENHLMFAGKVKKQIKVLESANIEGCVIAEGYNDYQLTEEDLAQFTLENKEGYTLQLKDNKIVMKSQGPVIDTQAKLQAAINASNGTAEAPEEITLTGEIAINSTITIEKKHVRLTGGTLKKAKSGNLNMLYVKYGTLELANIILDGAHDKYSGYCSFIQGYSYGESRIDIGVGTKLTNALGGNDRDNTLVCASAELTTLNGGEITGNFVEDGAVLFVDWGRTFVMNSGLVAANQNMGYRYMMSVIEGAGEITINGGTVSSDTRNCLAFYLYGAEPFIIGKGTHIVGEINMYNNRKITIASALVNPITFSFFSSNQPTGKIVAEPAKGYTLTNNDLNKIHYAVSNIYGLRLENGNIVAVNLAAENKTFNVKVADCTHGSVVANKATAKENEVITVTATPDEGYKLYSLRYNEVNELTASTSTTNAYTFNMPPMDATISAQFIKENVTVNPIPENPSDDPDDIQPDKTIGNIGDLIDALGGNADGTMELTPDTKAPTLDEEDPISDSIEEAENEGSTYIGSLEQLINVLSKDTKGQVVSSQSLTKLPCKVSLRFTLSSRLMINQELRAMAESGQLRAMGSGNYYILNQCEGKVTKIIPAYDAATNTLTFETDRLGIFAVMYANGGTTNEEVVRIEARVRAVDGQISIEDMPIGEPYAIYELSGKMLQNGVSDGTPIRFKPSATGNYVVRCGNMGQIIHFEK